MNITSSIAAFAAGAAIVDLVSPALKNMTTQTGPLASLSAIPGMSTASTTINSMISSATTQWNSVLSQLNVALPAMKAVHVLESKMAMASTPGVAPTQTGSASFQSYFGAIDNVKAQIATLQTSVTSSINALGTSAAGVAGVSGSGSAALTSLASTIPPATIVQNGNTVTNPAYTSFMSTNSSTFSSMTSAANSLNSTASAASTAVQAQFTAASSAFTSGVGNLKAMAFAQFCAQPQPQAVTDVINKTIDKTQLPTASDLSQASRSAQSWLSQQSSTQSPQNASIPDQTSSSPDPSSGSANVQSSPTSFTPSGCSSGQLSAIDAQVEAQSASLQTAMDSYRTAKATLDAMMKSLNWDQVQANETTDPTTWNRVYNQIINSSQSNDYATYAKAAKASRALYVKLLDVKDYMHKVGPLPGNPNGPWTSNDYVPATS